MPIVILAATKLRQFINEITPHFIQIRQKIHMHPELGYQEEKYIYSRSKAEGDRSPSNNIDHCLMGNRSDPGVKQAFLPLWDEKTRFS